jgi:DNA-directed RNA polymerase subunit N (RpoN/RPB10)
MSEAHQVQGEIQCEDQVQGHVPGTQVKPVEIQTAFIPAPEPDHAPDETYAISNDPVEHYRKTDLTPHMVSVSLIGGTSVDPEIVEAEAEGQLAVLGETQVEVLEDVDSEEVHEPVDDQAAVGLAVQTEQRPAKRKNKNKLTTRNTPIAQNSYKPAGNELKAASPGSLQQLAERFNNNVDIPSPIDYVVYSSVGYLSAVMTRPHPDMVKASAEYNAGDATAKRRMLIQTEQHAVDVMVLTSTVFGSFSNCGRPIANNYKDFVNMVRSDREPKAKRLGRISFMRYDAQNTRKFLAAAFVQYNDGSRNPEDATTVNLNALRKSLVKIFETFRNVRIGIMFFGDDQHKPTHWSEIESVIEAVCRENKRQVTVFVHSRVLVDNSNLMSHNLKQSAAKRGFAV